MARNESFTVSKPAEHLQLDVIFTDTSVSNPWVINDAEFKIVPAVPSKDTNVILRVAKEVSEDNKKKRDSLPLVSVPRQFIPVPAVPYVTTAPDDNFDRKPKATLGLSQEVDNALEEQKASSKKNEGGECIEKCIRQFCLPEKDLSKFSTCAEKCKNFCL